MVQTLWKTVWWLFIKLTVLIPYEPAITSLGIYPGKLKTFVYTKTCKRMFTAALFIKAIV